MSWRRDSGSPVESWEEGRIGRREGRGLRGQGSVRGSIRDPTSHRPDSRVIRNENLHLKRPWKNFLLSPLLTLSRKGPGSVSVENQGGRNPPRGGGKDPGRGLRDSHGWSMRGRDGASEPWVRTGPGRGERKMTEY